MNRELREQATGDLDAGLLRPVHPRDHQCHVSDLARDVVGPNGLPLGVDPQLEVEVPLQSQERTDALNQPRYPGPQLHPSCRPRYPLHHTAPPASRWITGVGPPVRAADNRAAVAL